MHNSNNTTATININNKFKIMMVTTEIITPEKLLRIIIIIKVMHASIMVTTIIMSDPLFFGW